MVWIFTFIHAFTFWHPKVSYGSYDRKITCKHYETGTEGERGGRQSERGREGNHPKPNFSPKEEGYKATSKEEVKNTT